MKLADKIFENPDRQATREGLGNAMLKLGQSNPKVWVVSAGLADSTRADKFAEKYPDRFVEVGIAEQNMIGMAAGAALGGKIPIATSFAVFLPGRCYDHIRQSIAYSNLNVKLVSTHAGITVGADGATHQMLEDVSMMRVLPNMRVVVPCDALEAEKAVLAAVEGQGPYYVRTGREKVPVLTTAESPFEIGKAELFREGKDVTIIANGIMVFEALKAARELEKQGIDAEVINCHTVKPLDEKAIVASVKKTGAVVTAEEHQKAGGLGAAVAELLSEKLPTPQIRVGVDDTFGESGPAPALMEKYGLTSKEIVKSVREVIKKK